jgi:hypothetical protein
VCGAQATDGSRWFPSKPDGAAGKVGPCISQKPPGPLPKKPAKQVEDDEDDESRQATPRQATPRATRPDGLTRLTSWPAAQERERGR